MVERSKDVEMRQEQACGVGFNTISPTRVEQYYFGIDSRRLIIWAKKNNESIDWIG